MTPQIAEVKSDTLWRLLRSPRFVRSLCQAASYTADEGREGIFVVARDLETGTFRISEVFHGNTEDASNKHARFLDEFDKYEFRGGRPDSDRSYSFLTLHFHPEVEYWPLPSMSDIDMAYYGEPTDDEELKKTLDIRPIETVAQVNADADIPLTLYQRVVRHGRMSGLQSELRRELALHHPYEPDEIKECLEGSGLLRAETLLLEKPSGYRPSRKDLAKLRHFTHTPTF